MKRILIAECGQEIASFNPVPSELDSFRLSKPAELIPEHQNLKTEIGGALNIFKARKDIELVGDSALAQSLQGEQPRRRRGNSFRKVFWTH